jgi:hypothetical protein
LPTDPYPHSEYRLTKRGEWVDKDTAEEAPYTCDDFWWDDIREALAALYTAAGLVRCAHCGDLEYPSNTFDGWCRGCLLDARDQYCAKESRHHRDDK